MLVAGGSRSPYPSEYLKRDSARTQSANIVVNSSNETFAPGQLGASAATGNSQVMTRESARMAPHLVKSEILQASEEKKGQGGIESMARAV